jgi:hypothetical protein
MYVRWSIRVDICRYVWRYEGSRKFQKPMTTSHTTPERSEFDIDFLGDDVREVQALRCRRPHYRNDDGLVVAPLPLIMSMMHQSRLLSHCSISRQGGAAVRWTSSFLSSSRPSVGASRGMIPQSQEQQHGLNVSPTATLSSSIQATTTTTRRWMGDDSTGSSDRIHSTE